MTAVPSAIGRLSQAQPPHLHSGLTPGGISRAFLLATFPVLAAGLVLYGRSAAGVLFFAVLGGVIGEVVVFHVVPRGPHRDLGYAVLTGLLLGLTLPVTVAWHIPFLGGLAAVGVGKGLLGGLGNYLWHPALVGRAALQLLFGPQLAPERWPVLAREHLWSGTLHAGVAAPYYRGYLWSRPPGGIDAWALHRPLDDLIVAFATPLRGGGVSGSGWLELFRDHLPPWRDTLWGTVGGGIGETCTVALLLGGLYLMYRGFLRWQSVAAALGAVTVLSAVLPIRLDDHLAWWPLCSVVDPFPAGIAWVLFHLTGGGLLLSCLLLAADPMTTPLTARGHIIFGAGVGVFTMAARWFGLTPGDSYWAILAMNTLVPLIDRWTHHRRPLL